MDLRFVITGEMVTALRAELGLGRDKFGKLCGLTPAKIYNIEKGRALSEDEARQLGELLRLHGRSLEAGDEAPVPADQPDVPGQPPALEPDSASADQAPSVDASSEDAHDASATSHAAPPEAQLENAASVVGSSEDAQLTPGVRYFSHSELRTFKECRRRWWLAWYRGLRPRVDPLIGARSIGDRIHRALKHHYVPAGVQPIDPLVAHEKVALEDWTALTHMYGEAGVPTEVRDEYDRDVVLERIMLEGYVEWLAESGEDAELTVIGSEQLLTAPVGVDVPFIGPDAQLVGRLDVRVRRRHDNVRLFLDHKNVGSFRQAVATLPLDEQMLHYHLLEWLNSDEGEERCQGALYNMLRRVKRTAQAKPPFYQRAEVWHSTRELHSYRLRVLGTIIEVARVQAKLTQDGVATVSVVYPTPTRDCAWKCPFFQVCPMFDDGSRVEEALEAHYTTGDPLDYYKTDVREGESSA